MIEIELSLKKVMEENMACWKTFMNFQILTHKKKKKP